ncbi:MAG: transposase [Chloroflexi bacterium]|nr:transposase [Chloroflexota bacterium]
MRNPNHRHSHRRSIRLRGYDYRKGGVYFVTICAYRKLKLFGSIIDGEMALSPLGEIACEEWRHIARARSNVELDRYVVMPNHLHGLFIVTGGHEDNLGQGAKSRHVERRPRLPAGSLGAIISQYKAAVSRRAWSGLICRSQRIWQRNYFDHILRDESSLNEIRKYIIENPARWRDDSLYVM